MTADTTTTTVYHPAFVAVSQEVPTADVEAWTDAGWRKTPVKK